MALEQGLVGALGALQEREAGAVAPEAESALEQSCVRRLDAARDD